MLVKFLILLQLLLSLALPSLMINDLNEAAETSSPRQTRANGWHVSYTSPSYEINVQ